MYFEKETFQKPYEIAYMSIVTYHFDASRD